MTKRFIKLTQTEKNAVFIDIDKITAVERLEDKKTGLLTVVYAGGDYFYVKESPCRILDLIARVQDVTVSSWHDESGEIYCARDDFTVYFEAFANEWRPKND